MIRTRALLAAALALALGCRQGSGNAVTTTLAPSTQGALGCNGPNQALLPGQVPLEVALLTLVLDAESQLCAALGAELLYATGVGATVVALDFALGAPPLESPLVSAGTFDALLAGLGIALPAQLGGIAVYDATSLVVVERTSNTLWLVDRGLPDTLTLLAGLPDAVPGFADGPAALARFSFSRSTTPLPVADGRVFVPDPGNHALRVLDGGDVATVAGAGFPFHADGDLFASGFDTPSGSTVSCTGELLVTEEGAFGLGGHRLRELSIGAPSFFGGFFGSSRTLAGSGADATTQGTGELAELARPVAPAASSAGEVYWIDAGTGVLRRLDLATLTCDCPLFVDCASALAAPPQFTAGGSFASAISDAGLLYVLDADAGKLLRVTP
jgi:hypothetical protein